MLIIVTIVCLLLILLSTVALACGQCGVNAGYFAKCLDDGYVRYGTGKCTASKCIPTIWAKHHELYCRGCGAAESGTLAYHTHLLVHDKTICNKAPQNICPY